MINSIQHFQEQGVKNLTEIFSHYTDDLTKFAEMVYGVTKEVTKLGVSLIEEELESYDELLRKRQDLRKGWYIERRDETKLLTSLGRNLLQQDGFFSQWSRTGADKMARLRIYRQNKRDILELVRYQKKELPLAAGTEEVIYSSTQMLSAERRNRKQAWKTGRYAGIQYSLSTDKKR